MRGRLLTAAAIGHGSRVRDISARSKMSDGGEMAPRYVRVESAADVPAPDPRAVDVAVLDMNHGWPNLGHDSLVRSLLEGDPERRREELRTGLFVRVLSYDVRR